ncbi:MAG: Rab family GTPase [Candidatus Helarchaeota archaeon]
MASSHITDVLHGIVVSKFGIAGPEAIGWFPNDKFESASLTEISVKAVSILAGEEGSIPDPENLSVLPIPKQRLSAVIFIFEVPDPQARGGAFIATVSVLFNQKYTSVIYKTLEDLARMLAPIGNRLIAPIRNNEDLTPFIRELYQEIQDFLISYQQDEITKYQIAHPAPKQYKLKYSFKVIVIGDPRVGKTTLLLRFVDKAFRELYIPTLGVQVSLKNLDFEEDTLVKFNLWDVAGQELFKQVRNNFYVGANAVLIVYDVTNPKSFRNVEMWYKDMRKSFSTPIPCVLVGNKIDLSRQVSRVDGMELAKKLSMRYIETSAKTGENVDKVFKDLATILVKKESKIAEWLLEE